MENVFIDCGYHQGAALAEFAKNLQMDETWTVYCYEPNPACHGYFPAVCRHGWHYLPHAVWTRDCTLLLRQEDWLESRSGSPIVNRNNRLDGWASTVEPTNSHAGLNSGVPVPAFDFAKLLRFFGGKNVIVKMDIEGAEFSVLRHLLETKTIGLISTLYVETHERLMPTESAISRSQLMAECEKHTDVRMHG